MWNCGSTKLLTKGLCSESGLHSLPSRSSRYPRPNPHHTELVRTRFWKESGLFEGMLWMTFARDTDYGCMMSKLTPQTQIDILLKCIKSLAFCRKNDWLMQNHGIRMGSDKICDDKNNPNISQNWPKNLGYYWKRHLLGVRSAWLSCYTDE